MISTVIFSTCKSSSSFLTPEEHDSLQGTLPDLPEDIWKEIYDRLPAQDILSLSLVCNQLNTKYQTEITDLVNAEKSHLFTESSLLKHASYFLRKAVLSCLNENGVAYLPLCLKDVTFEGMSSFNEDDLGSVFKTVFAMKKEKTNEADLLRFNATLLDTREFLKNLTLL